MKILADENIPFVREAFAPLGEVATLAGRAITPATLSEAECLLVRSVTKIDAALLENSRVRFVGTATSGFDHVDTDYLKSRDITFAYAPGSNALSVAEYVVAALLHYAVQSNIVLEGKTIAIVGVGRVGSETLRLVTALGMQPILVDPPVYDSTGDSHYRPLEEAISTADFVTFHTPLLRSGKYPTYHLVNSQFFSQCKPGVVFINAARGAVHETQSLKDAISKHQINAAALDVWEGEPVVDSDLLSQTLLASPHIAGYSFDGKAKGTQMLYESLCRFLNQQPTWNYQTIVAPPEQRVLNTTLPSASSDEEILHHIVSQAYNITADDADFRKTLSLSSATEKGDYFTRLRKQYPIRREFWLYQVEGNKIVSSSARQKLAGLGFEIL